MHPTAVKPELDGPTLGASGLRAGGVSRWPLRVAMALAGALTLVLAGCGEKRDPFQSREIPGDIEGSITYERHIKAVLELHCTRCHASPRAGADRQGAPADVNLDTFEDAVDHAERANVRIQSDTMPPGGGEVTDEERAIFQAWIDQGMQRGEPEAEATPTRGTPTPVVPPTLTPVVPPTPTTPPPPPPPTRTPTSGILPIPLPTLFPPTATPAPTAPPMPTPTRGPVTYEEDVKPFLDRKCVTCHDSKKSGVVRQGAPPGVNFDTYEEAVEDAERANVRIQERSMPPPPNEQVTDEEQRLFQQWIDDGLRRGGGG